MHLEKVVVFPYTPPVTQTSGCMGKPVIVKITNKYEFGKVIGHGKLGIVRLAKIRTYADRKCYAVKTIKKHILGAGFPRLKNELDKINQLRHPNVLHVHAIYEDTRYAHIVHEE